MDTHAHTHTHTHTTHTQARSGVENKSQAGVGGRGRTEQGKGKKDSKSTRPTNKINACMHAGPGTGKQYKHGSGQEILPRKDLKGRK